MATRSVFATLLTLLLSALPAQAQRATIQGVIRFGGAEPTSAQLPVVHDESYCGPTVPSRHLLINDGRVQDVVVYLEGVKPIGQVRARPLEVHHQKCDITAPVQTADAGAELVLHNGDAIAHTVAMRQDGKEMTVVTLDSKRTRSAGKVLSKPGLVLVGCTLHKWIYSYVWVFDHPFYTVSRADGRFELPFIVPGTYKLTAWHAELGSQTQEVTVGADQVLKVGFVFPGPRITQQ